MSKPTDANLEPTNFELRERARACVYAGFAVRDLDGTGMDEEADIERSVDRILKLIEAEVKKARINEVERIKSDWAEGYAGDRIATRILEIDLDERISQLKEPESEGKVGQVWGVSVAHTSNVFDKRKHIEPPEKCWCWEEPE